MDGRLFCGVLGKIFQARGALYRGNPRAIKMVTPYAISLSSPRWLCTELNNQAVSIALSLGGQDLQQCTFIVHGIVDGAKGRQEPLLGSKPPPKVINLPARL
jgi:hypothetical protein